MAVVVAGAAALMLALLLTASGASAAVPVVAFTCTFSASTGTCNDPNNGVWVTSLAGPNGYWTYVLDYSSATWTRLIVHHANLTVAFPSTSGTAAYQFCAGFRNGQEWTTDELGCGSTLKVRGHAGRSRVLTADAAVGWARHGGQARFRQ